MLEWKTHIRDRVANWIAELLDDGDDGKKTVTQPLRAVTAELLELRPLVVDIGIDIRLRSEGLLLLRRQVNARTELVLLYRLFPEGRKLIVGWPLRWACRACKLGSKACPFWRSIRRVVGW